MATILCSPALPLLLTAQDLAAILQEVRRQGDLLKDHEMRLDKHSEHIDKLRFKEEPQSTKTQADRATILRVLLSAKGGKMLAKDARQRTS